MSPPVKTRYQLSMLFTTISLWCLYTTCRSYTEQNSSGEYHIWIDTINKKMECIDSSFCYLQCTNCYDFTFITNSTSVSIDCIECDFLTVYAQYADQVMMDIMDSEQPYLHLDHAHDINITYEDVHYSVIYAPYGHNFRFYPLSTSHNLFYLDYVSNGIHFSCPGLSCTNALSFSTVAAFHAKNFTCSSNVLAPDNIIYCPSHSENVCVIDFDSLNDIQLHIANISYGFMPLTVTHTDNNYGSRFELFCNPNEHGIYQSSTFIGYNSMSSWSTLTKICSNPSSKCCFVNNQENRPSIFCNDSDSHCVIDCGLTNCNNSNIYPGEHTSELYFICSRKECYDTEVYCPTNPYSVCNITCSASSLSCKSVIVHSNTNNEYVNLQCSDLSCQYLALFVDAIETYPNTDNISTNINVMCGSVYGRACEEAYFYVNAEIEVFNITCADYSCNIIHVENARNTHINCLDECSLNVYGRSQSHNSIQLHGEQGYPSCSIFIEEQYELDYISSDGGILTSVLCSGEKEWPLIYANYNNKYENQYFCDPFRDNWSEIYYCNEDQTCDYTFHETQKTLIYANHARSLSILCTTQCSQMSVFVRYADKVTIHCTGECEQIKLNADHAHSLEIKCDSYCTEFIIDALYSEEVLIDSEHMISSEINTLQNTNLFSLRCHATCDDLDIVLSSYSSSKTSIECIGDNVCTDMRIYSANRSWNDITNLTIFSCENTTYQNHSTAPKNWFLFCPSSIPIWAYSRSSSYNPCVYLHNMQQPFCECDRLSDVQLLDHLVGAVFLFDPFGNELCFEHLSKSIEWKTFQQIFGTITAVVALCMICIAGIIFITSFVTNRLIEIEPVSFAVFRYVYVSDAFIWIIQIYLVVLCWAIRTHYQDVCPSLPLSVCDLHSNCHVSRDGWAVYEDECTLLGWPIGELTWLPLAILAVSVLCVLCGSHNCVCFGDIEEIPSRDTHCFTSVICNIYLYGIIKHQYKQRSRSNAFWNNSKSLLMFYMIRYVAFFIPPLCLFFVYIDVESEEIDFKVEWYDILPVLLLVFLNEILKKRYRMLPPYDEQKHVEFILTEYYGESIGLLIASFVGPVGEGDMIYQSNSLLHPVSDDSDADNDPVDTSFGDIEMEKRTDT